MVSAEYFSGTLQQNISAEHLNRTLQQINTSNTRPRKAGRWPMAYRMQMADFMRVANIAQKSKTAQKANTTQVPSRAQKHPACTGITALAFALTLSLSAISACSMNTPFSQPHKEEAIADTNNAKAAQLYNKVLENISNYSFDENQGGQSVKDNSDASASTSKDTQRADANDPTNDYTYALVRMSKSDVPQLLVSRPASKEEKNLRVVRIFTPNSDFTDVLSPNETLVYGATHTGKLIANISYEPAENSIVHTTLSPKTNKSNNSKLKPAAKSNVDEIALATSADGTVALAHKNMGEGSYDQVGTDRIRKVNFMPIINRKLLDELAHTNDGEYAAHTENTGSPSAEDADAAGAADTKSGNKDAAPTDEERLKAQVNAEKSNGRTVLAGTIRYMINRDIAKIQVKPDSGCSYPKEMMNKKQVILILDKSSKILATNGDGMGSRVDTANMVRLPDNMIQYADQHVIASFPQQDISWPSEAAIPYGEPYYCRGTNSAPVKILVQTPADSK